MHISSGTSYQLSPGPVQLRAAQFDPGSRDASAAYLSVMKLPAHHMDPLWLPFATYGHK